MPEILPLFSSPIYINDEISRLNIPFYNKILSNLEYERTPNNDGWITLDQSLLDDNKFFDIKNIIEENMIFYLQEVMKIDKNYQLKHVCSWAIYHDKGDWCRPHMHTNSLFSGVIYFNVPENSGQILDFYCADQIPTWCSSTIQPTVTEFNILNSKYWTVSVKPGIICIFPSHLMHQVPMSNSTEKRRCIAFNYFLTGKFGGKTSYVEF